MCLAWALVELSACLDLWKGKNLAERKEKKEKKSKTEGMIEIEIEIEKGKGGGDVCVCVCVEGRKSGQLVWIELISRGVGISLTGHFPNSMKYTY